MPLRTPQWTRALVAATLLITLSGCEGLWREVDEGPSSSPTKSIPDSTTALEQLKALKVARAGTMKDYSRERFPHWRSTGENCDVRDTVLKRDGAKVKVSGCNVVAGTWTSLYDGKVLASPNLVDIDHMVPLANAWRSGAATWTTEKRSDFANDLDEPQLIAVSAASNRSKGDQDPSTWKPPAEGSWCEYAQDWIAVKTHWKLNITAKEKTALTDMLRKC